MEVVAGMAAVDFDVDAGAVVTDLGDVAMEGRYVCRGSDIVVDGLAVVVVDVVEIVTGGQRAPGQGRWMLDRVVESWPGDPVVAAMEVF